MSFEISKEELYELYIVKNLSVKEISEKLNVGIRVIQRRLSKYEIKKDKKRCLEKVKQVCLEKYGVENVSQLQEVKQKKENKSLEKYGTKNISQSQDVKAKKQQKSLEKYGTKTVLQAKEIKEKIKETNMKKYDTNNPMKNEKVRMKKRNTCIKKYGVEYPQKLESTKQKAKKTLVEKYGVDNIMKVAGVKNKIKRTCFQKYGEDSASQVKEIKEKIKKTCLKKYGVPYACMREECRNANKGAISKKNKTLSNLLAENGIKNKLEFNINNFSYDIQILNTNILLEINPTYTHNITNGSQFRNHIKKPLEKDYHYNKTLNAKENGYRCIHIWDWDDIDKIVGLLKPKQKIYARDCKVEFVSTKTSNEFLNKYHIQSKCQGNVVNLTLKYLDNIIGIMTFGKPRYNKNYDWELLRLCYHFDFQVIGGTQRLFSHFLSWYNPKSIISYCDNSKFDGKIYNKLGFELLDYGKPSKHWYNGKRHITDNLLRQRGFDQLFGTNYGKRTSNKQLMLDNGFVEVYDSGQSTFVWKGIDLF